MALARAGSVGPLRAELEQARRPRERLLEDFVRERLPIKQATALELEFSSRESWLETRLAAFGVETLEELDPTRQLPILENPP